MSRTHPLLAFSEQQVGRRGPASSASRALPGAPEPTSDEVADPHSTWWHTLPHRVNRGQGATPPCVSRPDYPARFGLDLKGPYRWATVRDDVGFIHAAGCRPRDARRTRSCAGPRSSGISRGPCRKRARAARRRTPHRRSRAKPCASTPHVRKSRNSCSTNFGSRWPSA